MVDIVHHVFSGLCNMLSVGNFCYNNHLKLKIIIHHSDSSEYKERK